MWLDDNTCGCIDATVFSKQGDKERMGGQEGGREGGNKGGREGGKSEENRVAKVGGRE